MRGKKNLVLLVSESASKGLCERISNSISELTGLPIKVSIKSRAKKAPEEIITSLSRNELIVAIHSLIEEQKTHVILLLSVSGARRISEILLLQANMELSDEEALDALREFGNIVFGTLTSELSRKVGGKVTYTLPEVVIDYDVAIIESLIAPLAMVKDVIEILEFSITSGSEEELGFDMLMIPGDNV